MLTPDEITDDTFRRVAAQLLNEQARYTAVTLIDEVCSWSEDFISDDGTDYVTTSLDAVASLMSIRYEGDAEDLRLFLFTGREEADPDEALRLNRHGCGLSLAAIDSAGGLCPTLREIANHVDGEEG